ncbi:MAG: Lin0512 family protein [Clostridiaceae bacterium]|nr:Lin0512 family protein [Clostridiaceae bacterium]
MWKRYIVELGWGADLHGQDVTKAAERAVKDAISRSCLCGLKEILGMKDLNEVAVHVTIATPYPEEVDKKTIESVKGGMEVPGLYVKEFGDCKDSIVVANAYVEVKVLC